MNLLVISNTFPNHDNTYVGNLFVKEQIKYLKKYFDNIYFVSPVPYGIGYLRKTKHEKYEFDNVKVYFPRYLNFPPFYFWNRDLWIYFEMKTIKKLIAKEKMKFDLIHAHYTWPSGVVAVEMKKEFKVPVVITEHTSTTFRNAIENKDPIYLKTWKACDAIIRVRKGDICDFIMLGINKDKIYHVPNGYDPNKMKNVSKQSSREKLELPQDKRILFNLANLVPCKGHRYLIEAIEEVLNIRKDILCIIGGKGPLKKSLEKQIKPMKNFIKLLGFIPQNEIQYWFNAADIFVLSSISESFGIVQIEAMACGKPIVATINGGSEEIIISEDYGLLCEPAKPKELANKILIALEKDWDREKILKYVKRFTWDNIAKEIMEIYKLLI